MIIAVIDLIAVSVVHSRANLQKVGAVTWSLTPRNFFIEREYLYVLLLKIFTFLIASDHVTTLVSLSVYIVYYYISYIIRNIIKLIKRRDIDKREKEKEIRFSLVTCVVTSTGHFRKSQQFLGRQVRKSSLLFSTEQKTLRNVIAPVRTI